MRRLLKKQGFTMVELIVVVAIIGIMLGIVVPLLTTSSAREREAKEKARAFYSNVQELIVDEKLSGTPLSGNDYTLIYATVSPQPGTSAAPDIKVYTAGADHIADFDPTIILTEIASGDDLEEFSNSLQKLLSSNDQEIDVYYYAVVDNKYRLVVTYYSQGDFGDVAGQSFSSECRVGSGNTLTGAYPYGQCGQGLTVFHD